MTSGDPLRLLSSTRPSERLRAIRMLDKSNETKYLGALHAARLLESDSWVQSAMDRVIHRWQHTGGQLPQGKAWFGGPSAGGNEDVYAKATQRVTETLLHELRPIVGSLKLAASDELGSDFSGSETSALIGRMRDLLWTVEKLHQASAAPRFVEFDLVDCIATCIKHAGFEQEQVLNSRQETVIALGDPDLLSLALVNGIKNAVEASENTESKVIINCAVTDTDAWVAILDEGIGLPDGFDSALEPGRTNKSKAEHFGWGLAIAHAAAVSLGGTIRLTPRTGGGTSCEIRWKLAPEEDIV